MKHFDLGVSDPLFDLKAIGVSFTDEIRKIAGLTAISEAQPIEKHRSGQEKRALFG